MVSDWGKNMNALLKIGLAACAAVVVVAPVSPRAADRVVTLAPIHPLYEAVRLGTATGGPTLKAVVPSDVAQVVFTSASDDEPVAGWFDRTFKAALKKNGMLAKKPDQARYELSAVVNEMMITPMVTGSHHKSIVSYRLVELASGTEVWKTTDSRDFDVNRGMRFGAIGGALGAAAGGAIAGQNPAVTAAMINSSQRGRRPFDIRIDTYEGIMRGFQQMAESAVLAMSRIK
jgi:hypothetical protein